MKSLRIILAAFVCAALPLSGAQQVITPGAGVNLATARDIINHNFDELYARSLGLTSVGITLPGGLTVSNSPLTSNGTINVTCSLSGLVKVMSGNFAAAVAGTDYLTPAGDGSQLTGLTKAQVGLGAVENTALSTWTGSTNLVTVGTITSGAWHGTAIGDTWISSAATWNAKQSALTFSTGLTNTSGTITVNAISLAGSGSGGVTGILPKANGGTGTSSPALVAGTNVTITGAWPNQTINASGGGGGGLLAANNLSDLTDAAAARANLGADVAYEAALGNPDADGKVLSSTAAGVRSWVAASGGGAAPNTWSRQTTSFNATKGNSYFVSCNGGSVTATLDSGASWVDGDTVELWDPDESWSGFNTMTITGMLIDGGSGLTFNTSRHRIRLIYEAAASGFHSADSLQAIP